MGQGGGWAQGGGVNRVGRGPYRLAPASAAEIVRRGAQGGERGQGVSRIGLPHSRRGTHRRAPKGGWAWAWWAGAHLGLGRELERSLHLDEHALGDAELERVLERQVVLRAEARAQRVGVRVVCAWALAVREGRVRKGRRGWGGR